MDRTSIAQVSPARSRSVPVMLDERRACAVSCSSSISTPPRGCLRPHIRTSPGAALAVA
jgi:hypothetical protein